jgi:Skp family chaperone for outer membrane proteins
MKFINKYKGRGLLVCKAIDYASNINTQITEAREYYDKLKIKERVFNDVQQDLLHKIEGLEKFSLYTGWKFCMALCKLRKARRKTKNELKTMELLVKQLGGFSIKETKIDKQASHLEQLSFENGYHKRQLDMTGDILEEVDSIVNKIIYKKQDEIAELDETKIYNISEKIPKIKGSNVKMAFKSQAQKKHLIENYSSKYERFKENNTEEYVEFINRKTDK